ncbi:ABC transporter permease [Deinococcus sp.]|uniref:ABC transporter permease n=1 Tax=Deinococcus sp. TaxID=47478 RepID=UPI0025E1040D|nr:ABC transporter permease [Deinococcus sp.]
MLYLLRKFALLLLTLFVAATINFFLPRLIPGDAVGAMMAKYQGNLSPQAADALRLAYGLGNEGSAFQEYLKYLVKLLHGDFGRSITQFPTPAADVIAAAAPWTIGLIGVCTLISFLIGSALGLYSAWKGNQRFASALPAIGLFLGALPYFWVGSLLVYVFSLWHNVFPLGGNLDPFIGDSFTPKWWSSMLRHAVLPACSIIITAVGGWLVTMRNNAVSVMGEDYLAFARAKGLSERRILSRYVLRNAMLPSLTGFGIALGFVVGGSILVEQVYSYPGLGYYLFSAVTSKDFPLMQAIFLIISAAVLIANFLVDILYTFLDPRVRTGLGA